MDDVVKRSERSRYSESAVEESELGYLLLCKGEVIYVDEGYGLDMWDRISVSIAKSKMAATWNKVFV